MEYGRGKKVIEIAVGKRACTFDPMEKTLHKGIRKQQQMTRRQFSMIHEYPLDGNRP
jgi:Ca2+-transporting ATPase